MKVRVEVELRRVDGKNLSAEEVRSHIMDHLISPGEVPSEPGQLWVGGTHYEIVAVHPVLP